MNTDERSKAGLKETQTVNNSKKSVCICVHLWPTMNLLQPQTPLRAA